MMVGGRVFHFRPVHFLLINMEAINIHDDV